MRDRIEGNFSFVLLFRISTTVKKDDKSLSRVSADIESLSDSTVAQKPITTTITKIANRHFNQPLGLSIQNFNVQEDEGYQVVISAGLKMENNFTFEDRKDSIPSPERKIIVQEQRPEQPVVNITKQDEGDKENQSFQYHTHMFESMQSSETDELYDEQPRDLQESLLNLDTYTGKVELYEDQNDEDEISRVYDEDQYIVLKPSIEKRRMITLPKNNEYVNISDLLSRSFIADKEPFRPNQSL